jgi:hypothetical protein
MTNTNNNYQANNNNNYRANNNNNYQANNNVTYNVPRLNYLMLFDDTSDENEEEYEV